MANFNEVKWCTSGKIPGDTQFTNLGVYKFGTFAAN